MGKVNIMLEYLAIRQMNMDIYNMLSEEERPAFVDKVKRDIDEEMQAKAFKEVLMSKYKSYYSKLLDDEDEDILPLIKQMNIERREKEEAAPKTDYSFITVNPRPDVPLSEFRKIVEKSSNKSFIKQSLYVIEQRGENMDELGKGFHMHMLINKGDYRPSHLQREFARTFKNVCDVETWQCFNIKPCKESDLRNRQRYMLGLKKDPTKHVKQKYDVIYRDKYAIKSYYGEKFVDEEYNIDFSEI